ncbi:MAG: hypothetical protein M3220_07925 [Chloroflexota bacterium]|nr:hypothetical protein [Chloroflexota bacterium]
MILVQSVFQAKYGKGNELVELFQEGRATWGSGRDMRILTDASGPFFTVVTQAEVESLGEWEQQTQEIFNHPAFGEWFNRMTSLVESGRREFYHIVA